MRKFLGVLKAYAKHRTTQRLAMDAALSVGSRLSRKHQKGKNIFFSLAVWLVETLFVNYMNAWGAFALVSVGQHLPRDLEFFSPGILILEGTV